MMIKKVSLASITILATAATFLTLIQLTNFLSNFSNVVKNDNISSSWYFTGAVDGDVVSTAIWCSIVDIALLIVFIVQHSLLTKPLHKLMASLDMEYMQRVVYNLFASLVLQMLMVLWCPIPNYVVWSVPIEADDSVVWKVPFQLLHGLLWLCLYVMAISLDLPHMLGIRQFQLYVIYSDDGGSTETRVYHHLTGVVKPNPASNETQLVELQTKMKHPGLISLSVILWVYPIMRLDRLLIAVIWTVYMALSWELDENDYNYVLEQRSKKFRST